MATDRDQEIRAGSLGILKVQPGYCVYVGSAFGPGGLAARVLRHQRQHKKLRWHIDYLRAVVAMEEVWYTLDAKRRECQWADTLAQMPGCSWPLAGFGASDCPCVSHLFYFQGKPSIRVFRRLTRRLAPGRAPIRRLTAGRIPLSYARD